MQSEIAKKLALFNKSFLQFFELIPPIATIGDFVILLAFFNKLIDARKIIKKKIIGITCHNSTKLAKLAIKNNADYLAFGAFYTSRTKKTKFKADLSLLKKVTKITKTPIVAIGGINFENYKKLLLNKANFLAISGYIWNNKKLKPIEAIKKLK